MDASDRRRRASEEAAAWWVRLQAEDRAQPERGEFVDWLRESPVHVAEMLRVAKVHDALEKFRGWAQIPTDEPDNGDDGDNVVALLPSPGSASSLVSSPSPDGETHRAEVALSEWQRGGDGARYERYPGTSRRRLWLGAIAAGLAAIAILGVLISPFFRGQTIQTERGERRELALADGSVIEVDPETRLRVMFEEHTRRVLLERGRALFRVAKNVKRPFLVHADGTTVRAVGTAFGVEWQQQGVVVTVSEGRVGVFPSAPSSLNGVNETPFEGGASSAPTTSARHPAEVLLTAGQQVRMHSSGDAEPVRKVDSERELAWAKGRLVFDNETVAAAIEKFNRYNRVQLHVVDDPLGMRPVSGVFDASDPESFIAFLQTVASVRVTRGESEIIMQ